MRCKELKEEIRIKFETFKEAEKFCDFLDKQGIHQMMFGKKPYKPPVYLYIPKSCNSEITLENINEFMEQYLENQ